MTPFRKYLLLSLLIALVNVFLVLNFFVPRYDHSDTKEYVAVIKHIMGDSGADISMIKFRFFRPMPLLIGVFLNPALTPLNSLVFQSVIFYLVSVWLIFFVIYNVYKNEQQAFYGATLFSSSYPVLAYGIAPLTDMAGWFFFILCLFLFFVFLKKPSTKFIFLVGLIASFAMLFKENIAAFPIFFAVFLFLSKQFSLREKIKYILILGLTFLIFPLIVIAVVYVLYSYSYIEWLKIGLSFFQIARENAPFYSYGLKRFIIEIARMFLLGWIFFFWGFVKELKTKDKERIKFLIAFTVSSLSIFFWTYLHNRIMFISAPLLVLLASYGIISEKRTKFAFVQELAMLFLYVLTNYFFLDLILKYGEALII